MVVVCGTSENRYVSRVLDYTHFQPPNFAAQTYLAAALEAVDSMFTMLGADASWHIYICRGYILSQVRDELRKRGYTIEETAIGGKTQHYAEQRYNQILRKLGCPRHQQKMREWLIEDEPNRKKYAKTGWKKYRELASRAACPSLDSFSCGDTAVN